MTADYLDVEDDLDLAQSELYEQELTDGLPVIPPVPARVEAAIAASGLPGDEVVAAIPPLFGEATVEKIAANAVMAGCLPDYMPVVLAAVRAVCTSSFNLYGIQDTTNPVAPLVIVNGPIRTALNMNPGTNAFGQGNRANATIGRALRLILLNIGGGKPGELDRATQGMPGKYTFCAPEHEERNPWSPFHVERGLQPDDSAVTVFGVHGFHNIIDLTASTAPELMDMLAAGMAVIGTNNMTHGGDTVLALAPEHAEQLHAGGYSKDDVRRYLFERARADITRLPDAFVELMLTRRPRWVDPRSYPVVDTPEEIHLLVVGGPGIHSAFLPMFGSTRAVTERVRI